MSLFFAGANKGLVVDVFWGFFPAESRPLVGEGDTATVDEDFDFSDPWAQRWVRSMCKEAPKALGVKRNNCWINRFRRWLLKRGSNFPSLQVVSDIEGWQKSEQAPWRAAWTLDSGKVASTYLSFEAPHIKKGDFGAVVAHMETWVEFLGDWNEKAPASAKSAHVSSKAWATAVFRTQLVSGTATTVLIIAGTAFGTMLIFSRSPLTSLYVVMMTLNIIVVLLFFMVCVNGWPIGPIETLSVVIFAGYSVTYSLNLANVYGTTNSENAALMTWMARRDRIGKVKGHGLCGELSPAQRRREERIARVCLALSLSTRSIMNSAGSTVVASLPLLFCTITIFPRLGSIIIVVTLASLFMSLIVLPATLMVAGPMPRKDGLRCGAVCRTPPQATALHHDGPEYQRQE
jgi:hypothetical protein